jgi:lipopolysaccharide transport system permease protein
MRGLWEYRRFILGLAGKDFRQRYMGSLLGALWLVLNPLALILIYTIVFGKIMGHRLPGMEGSSTYGIFLCAGVLPWGLFAETLQRCTSIFVEEGNLIKKMAFPRLALPAVVFVSGAMSFAVTFAVLTVILGVTGHFPGWALLQFLPLLLLQQCLALTLGVVLGILNVFFRDVGHATGILVQYWFWFTPVVYPSSVLPEWARSVLALNPMTGLVNRYQAIVLGTEAPSPGALLPAVLAIGVLLLVARVTYRRFAAEMPDYL